MSKKLLLIVNPCSGKAKMKTELLKVVQDFSDADYEVTVYPTKSREDATVRTRQVKQDEFDLVVVCGGDGTLNEAISGFMETGVKVTLGYIPAGTLNEWSSNIGISRNILQAAKDIPDGKVITLDTGKFGDKYFTYTASFGAFTSASYSVPQNVKNTFGQAAYFFEGIKELVNLKTYHLKFECEEKTVEGDYIFGGISNSLSLGGVLKFEESMVKLNDGYFEVVLIKKPDNILKYQPLIDALLHKKFDYEGIEFFHTKAVKVSGGDGLSWTLDGEYAAGTEELLVENIPSGITLIVPDTSDKKGKKKKSKQ